MPVSPGALHALVFVFALFFGFSLRVGIVNAKYRRKISKLYLNFRSVMNGLTLELLEANDFDEAIICCSQSELEACSAMGMHKVGITIIEKARREGRLIFRNHHEDSATTGDVNRLLQRFKCQQISGDPECSVEDLQRKPSILVDVEDANQINQIRIFWVRPRDPNNPTNTLLTGTHKSPSFI